MFFLHSFIQPYTSGAPSCRYPGCKDWVIYSPKWRRFPLHISKYLAQLCLGGTAEVEIYTGMRHPPIFKKFCVYVAHTMLVCSVICKWDTIEITVFYV